MTVSHNEKTFEKQIINEVILKMIDKLEELNKKIEILNFKVIDLTNNLDTLYTLIGENHEEEETKSNN